MRDTATPLCNVTNSGHLADMFGVAERLLIFLATASASIASVLQLGHTFYYDISLLLVNKTFTVIE